VRATSQGRSAKKKTQSINTNTGATGKIPGSPSPPTQRHRSPFLGTLSDFYCFRESWQLGDSRGDPSCLIVCEQLGGCAPTRFILKIDKCQFVTGAVLDDETGAQFFD
jgi:hypothetical protein